MKRQFLIASVSAAAAAALVLGLPGNMAGAGDENHETIEKVMKVGLKGDESLFGKVKAGAAEGEDFTELYELIRTLRGTTAPEGEQAAYDEKVEGLIFAAGAAAYGDKTEAVVASLKDAANCKACHNEHKPE